MHSIGPLENWYCDDNAQFNLVNQGKDAMDGHDLDCTGTGRSISRNKSAWAPYMRDDGKCFYAHFKGKHKCYVTRTQNYRLCGCVAYETLKGEDYTMNPAIKPMDESGAGWH